MGQLLRVGFQTADEIAGERFFSPSDDASILHHTQTFQVPPEFPVAKRFRHRGRTGRAMLFSPMSFFVRLVAAALRLGKSFRFLLLEVSGNILVQRVLVLLKGENVVRLLLANLAGDGAGSQRRRW